MEVWKYYSGEEMAEVECHMLQMVQRFGTNIDRRLNFTVPKYGWQSTFTNIVRDYLVYYLVHTTFRFLPHQVERRREILTDPRFESLTIFFIQEERKCFLAARNKMEYFKSLKVRVLSLVYPDTSLCVEKIENPPSEDTEPCGPVFHMVNVVPPLNDILKTEKILQPRFPVDDIIDLDDVTKPCHPLSIADTMPLLCRRQRKISAHLERRPLNIPSDFFSGTWALYLDNFEKRLNIFTASVKAITQPAKSPAQGLVINILGKYIYFVPSNDDMDMVKMFLSLREEESKKTTTHFTHDSGTVRALNKFPEFLTMLEDATCMPEAFFESLNQICKYTEEGQLGNHRNRPRVVRETTPAIPTEASNQAAKISPDVSSCVYKATYLEQMANTDVKAEDTKDSPTSKKAFTKKSVPERDHSKAANQAANISSDMYKAAYLQTVNTDLKFDNTKSDPEIERDHLKASNQAAKTSSDALTCMYKAAYLEQTVNTDVKFDSTKDSPTSKKTVDKKSVLERDHTGTGQETAGSAVSTSPRNRKTKIETTKTAKNIQPRMNFESLLQSDEARTADEDTLCSGLTAQEPTQGRTETEYLSIKDLPHLGQIRQEVKDYEQGWEFACRGASGGDPGTTQASSEKNYETAQSRAGPSLTGKLRKPGSAKDDIAHGVPFAAAQRKVKVIAHEFSSATEEKALYTAPLLGFLPLLPVVYISSEPPKGS